MRPNNPSSSSNTWLHSLPSHPIFSLPPLSPSSSSSKTARTPSAIERDRREEGSKKRLCIARGNELFVAVGREVRVCNLVEVKSRTAAGGSGGIEGGYKVLNTPIIDFEIHSLLLNPTHKLLAVVGHHSIAVIVLPRKGWSGALGGLVECRSILIGKYHHHLPSSPRIHQALWHPFGPSSSSLLILTSDSKLREYSLGSDAEEPLQTLDFLSRDVGGGGGGGGARGGGGGFGADDKEGEKVVRIAIGGGKGDWGKLTLFALRRNGELVAVCPFLPKMASIPTEYIHALSCFITAKVDYLHSTSSPSPSPFEESEDSLSLTPFNRRSTRLDQSTLSNYSTTSSDGRNATRNMKTSPLSRRYAHQLRYINSLVRQTSTLSSDTPFETEFDDSTLPEDQKRVNVVAPHSGSLPVVQGPFLLQPPGAELESDVDNYACDLIYLDYEKEGGTGVGVGVLAIVYFDGKVEICLEVEKVEGKWGDEEDEDQDQEEEDEDSLREGEHYPSLSVLETIDLGLISELQSNWKSVEIGLEGNEPTFVRDPLYDDLVYVYHSLGAHCLSFSPWLEGISKVMKGLEVEGEEEGEEEEEKIQSGMEKNLRELEGTEVVWIVKTLSIGSGETGQSQSERRDPSIVGMVLINDVYLGYSMLLTTEELQTVGIELSLRVDLSLLPSNTNNPTPARPSPQPLAAQKGVATDPPAYLSLLDSPFQIPSILSSTSSSIKSTRLVIKTPQPSTSSSSLLITPETLRFMGTTVTTFRHAIRDLVEGADQVQCRLELQMKELSRQLSKLNELNLLAEDLRKSTSSSALLNRSGNDESSLAGRGGILNTRLNRVELAQRGLLERTDRVLQRLMEGHEPVLSSFEKKWFEELGRVEREVLGGGGGGRGTNEASLEKRARRVVEQVESLRPALEELRRKEEEGRKEEKKFGTSSGGLGGGQMRVLEANLANESKMIAEARQKLDRLTSLLAKSSLV